MLLKRNLGRGYVFGEWNKTGCDFGTDMFEQLIETREKSQSLRKKTSNEDFSS